MDTKPFTIRDAIDGTLKRRKLVLTIFVLVMILTGAATLLATKTYDSQAKIFVRLGRENVGLGPTETLGESTTVAAPMNREAEINSVVHMIRNRGIYEEVVDEFGAQQILTGNSDDEPTAAGDRKDQGKNDSGFSIRASLESMGILNKVSLREQAVIKLSSNVSIKALDRSNIIQVGYEANNPKLAQDVVNYLIERYIDLHLKLHRSTGAFEFMEKQTAEIAGALKAKEKELEDFKVSTGMLSSDLDKQVLVARIATIKNQLRDASVEAVAYRAEVDEMQISFASLDPTIVASKTTGAGNQGVDGMRQQLYRQEIELAEMRGTLTDGHPNVRSLVQAIVKTKAILRTAETGRTESVEGANPARSEIHVELLKKQSQLLAAAAKVKILTGQLAIEQKTQILFSQNERKFLELTRELQLQEESYRKYVRGVSQANVDLSLEKSKLSNISVSQAASFNEKPLRPNKLINLVIGFALATLASFGMAICLAYLETTSLDQLDDAPVEAVSQVSPAADVDVSDASDELPAVAASTRVHPHFSPQKSGN